MDKLEWQCQGDHYWVLGEMIRGLVRYKRATVSYLNDWKWSIVGTSHYGHCETLDGAVHEVEKILGIY